GATREHDVPRHLEDAEPHRIEERADDVLLADPLLGREIKRVDLAQGMIRGIAHHALEPRRRVVAGRLTQGRKQGLGFAHAPTLFNYAAPCRSRRRHAARRTISRHWHGSRSRRGPAPNPCCRARARGARRVVPARPGWTRTSREVDDTRRAPSHPRCFRPIARPRDPAASWRGCGWRPKACALSTRAAGWMAARAGARATP